MDISEVCKYIRDNSEEELCLEEVAKHFGYSKYHFSRKFKQKTGYSYKQYIEALKIEQSIELILDANSNITQVFIESKHESSGTFSGTFKKLTGLSPKIYKKSINILYKMLLLSMKDKKEITYRKVKSNAGGRISIRLHYPEIHDERISFIGLFENGIPNSAPIVGKALYKCNNCVLDLIPEGRYHILVTEIDLTSDISSYFLLNNNYRAKLDHKLLITKDTDEHFDLYMRLSIPEDPPILVNLPHLVKQALLSEDSN